MNYIDFKVRAKNSSGEQTLTMTEDGGDFWLTLHGIYNGQRIQIDFDALTKREIEDIKTGFELLIPESEQL